MPPQSKKRTNLVPRRRRTEDEGEEEGSVLGDFEDDSLSEGSAISTVDDEADNDGSEGSGEESSSQRIDNNKDQRSKTNRHTTLESPKPKQKIASQDKFQASADTEAFLNGLQIKEDEKHVEEVHFDDLPENPTPPAVNDDLNVPRAPRNESMAQRSRREHQEYIQQRNTNPAFVPNRGGFFLHDDRSSASNVAPQRMFGRGRGRGYVGVAPPGRRNPPYESSEKAWAHDLHENHEIKPEADAAPYPPAQNHDHAQKAPQQTTKMPTPTPNRSFSFTSTVGNVPVHVFLPGMSQKKTIATIVKKQHTLLPQHRPPLRRDKPVRISIPDQAPRYIFPSTERSFIFIPRALRPNNQVYTRGRGRGSYHGSRRASTLGGSAYTPSIAMSRKSSFGGVGTRNDMVSPAGSAYARSIVIGGDSSRPVVRLPQGPPTPALSQPASTLNGEGRGRQHVDYLYGFPEPSLQGRNSSSIPIHQPRPQKTVSVADIESPAAFPYKTPQPQQELPFHQQMPPQVGVPFNVESISQSGPSIGPNATTGTPLTHIPEGAVYAHAFQPYSLVPGPNYYPGPYPNGNMYYPPMTQGMSYGVPGMDTAMAPNFVPGSQTHPITYVPSTNPGEANAQVPTMVHETNGMVYYYGPPQIAGDGQNVNAQIPLMANGSTMGMGPISTPQNSFYYPSVPNGMFYSTNQP